MKPNKGKKLLLILCLTMMVALLLAGTTILIEKNKLAQIRNTLETERTNTKIYQDIISYPMESFENKFVQGDIMLVYMGNLECSDCSTFYPILKKKLEKYNLKNKLIYIECSHLRSNKDEWIKFKKKYSFTQTPAFIIFKNSRVLTSIEWDDDNNLNEATFDNWISKNEKVINSISL
jgi:thiol-disulfide isomerase/thioredoxin